MRVAVSGSHGLIGSALVAALSWAGHDVVPITRLSSDTPTPGAIAWDPVGATADSEALSKVQAVVHLAGEPIGDRRWKESTKEKIRDSRVFGTQALARALVEADPQPAVLVSGSAIGFYGVRGNEILTEASASGDGFLASVCRKWESATEPAEQAGVRVVRIRTGIVLSRRGGTLARMLPLFRIGLGGRLGSGDQWFSWISLDDEIRAILHILDHDEIRGPVNLTAPGPVTNREFTKALGRSMRRPTVLPVPESLMKVAMGRELAEELVLGGQRVLPAVLTATGFEFTHPDIDSALLAAINEEI